MLEFKTIRTKIKTKCNFIATKRQCNKMESHSMRKSYEIESSPRQKLLHLIGRCFHKIQSHQLVIFLFCSAKKKNHWIASNLTFINILLVRLRLCEPSHCTAIKIFKVVLIKLKCCYHICKSSRSKMLVSETAAIEGQKYQLESKGNNNFRLAVKWFASIACFADEIAHWEQEKSMIVFYF